MIVELNLIKYSVDKENIKSLFTFNLKYNDLIKEYLLKTPLNPLLDIEILKLYNLEFKKKILKIKEIIKNKEFCYKTSISLKIFIDWINIQLSEDENIYL